jgi:hypothetical protein
VEWFLIPIYSYFGNKDEDDKASMFWLSKEGNKTKLKEK